MDGVSGSGLSGTGLTSTVWWIIVPFRACNNATSVPDFFMSVSMLTKEFNKSLAVFIQTTTSQHTSSNNNYFNAPRFHDASFEVIANLKVDVSGNFTTLDPGFVNAAAGNFKVSNQTLLDNSVGDPRWLQ